MPVEGKKPRAANCRDAAVVLGAMMEHVEMLAKIAVRDDKEINISVGSHAIRLSELIDEMRRALKRTGAVEGGV